jgi:hypothetical protein
MFDPAGSEAFEEIEDSVVVPVMKGTGKNVKGNAVE